MKSNKKLNKFEKMLLESKSPTLRILLEEESEGGGLDDLFGGGDDKSKDSGKEEKSKEESSSDEGGGGLDDLFDGGDDKEGDKEESGGEEGGEGEGEAAEGEEDAAATEAGGGEEDPKSKEELKKKEEEAVQKAAEQSAKTFQKVVGGNIDTAAANSLTNRLFDDLKFNSNSMKKESVKYQLKRINENITKYLFRNVSMKSVKHKRSMTLSNFKINENKLLKINNVLNESKSVDDMINNEFWDDNASIDIIVNNAINLTKNFQDLIDIPALIMNSVAIKFGKQAAEESSDNKNAENEYKVKLNEFLDMYSKQLSELSDYENYDTSRFRFDSNTPDHAAVGAMNPGT